MPTPWTDAPIAAKSDDAFGRAGYAVHAARLIAESHSWSDSIVFGLTGPWGSGKSSMLAMIAEELNTSFPDWQVARFTPWATGDVAGLLGDFYTSLSHALPNQKSKQLRNALGTLVQVAAPAANALPFAGGAAASAANAAGTALKKQTPWDKAFKTAADELRRLNTPVLMIADDIDRLQTEELLSLLKVVRLLGRFPGVHYLLAYDTSTLFQALSEASLVDKDGGAAARFMEKIVQYPLVVPPLLSAQLLARLDSGLDEALADAGRPQPAGSRLGRLVDVYRSQLGTPRAIDRYLAQLRHHLPLVPSDEINDEDVIVLTLLRSVFPTLYQQLPRWRENLLSGHTDEFKTSSKGVEYEAFDIEPLLELVPKASRSDARTLLIDLFPRLQSQGSSFVSSDTRRIHDDRYFDRYFAMGIPAHDVSDVEVANATANIGHGDTVALAKLLSQSNPDRLVLVVDKGRRFTEQLPKNDAGDVLRLNLVKLLVVALDSVHDQPSFFMSPRQRVAAWASQAVAELTNQVTADALIKALNATSSLTVKIEVVWDASQKDERPAGLNDVVTSLCAQAEKDVIAHFKAQDSAAEDVQPGTLIHFVLRAGQVESLATAVAAGLASGDFTIADVAARVVPTRILLGVGTKYELSDFDQETFNSLVPSTPDPWYKLPRAQVDKYDLSWANRRAYAAGRAKKPIAS